MCIVKGRAVNESDGTYIHTTDEREGGFLVGLQQYQKNGGLVVIKSDILL